MTAVGKKIICSLLDRTENESGLQSDGARLITCLSSYLCNCVVSSSDVDGTDKIKNKKPGAK